MKKYKVIYADPPWAYKVWSKKGAGRSAESHYPTMDIEAIKALPVGELADKDCALFLWITFPMLREAWGVMDAWGFTFKTVPRIELFARASPPGWDVWGNEVASDIRLAERM